MPNLSESTPCGVMFDVLKRCGHINHNELATMVLSGRMLPDGRSPLSRASDRTWVSRFVVRAPVGSLQPRYFADFSTAALRITNRLRSRRGRPLSDVQIIHMITGEEGRAMDRALVRCHQDAHLYRNALERLASTEGHTDGERAEAMMVLFVATACTANARVAVDYTMKCARVAYEMVTSTPSFQAAAGNDAGTREGAEAVAVRPLGLIRVADGYVVGEPRWIDPERPVTIGALALGEDDITDVGVDVSAEHARVVYTEQEGWQVEDLGSKNGTTVLSGATGEELPVAPGTACALATGDELRLGLSTTYVVIR